MRKGLALAGFLLLGLSPSFVDFQQADTRQRREIMGYYVVALALIYFGVMKG